MRNRALGVIRAERLLLFVVAVFLALGIVYSVVTPIFEAGDELWHYPFVQSLATGQGLPVQDPNRQTLWEQEGGQPPLYYALSALATFWIDTRDLPERLWRNPEAKIGIPLAFGNKNMVVHTSAENFPWQGATLAVHLIRLLSILLSAFTVVLTYLFALELKSDKRLAALAASIVAFTPMFIFISASVNNDNLATMLATLSLLLLARLVTRGATLRRFVVLGIVLGLGALTKISNLGLLLVAGFVFLFLLWKGTRQGDMENRRHGEGLPVSLSPRRLVFGMFLCAVIVVAIAFWWYARNWILYSDPLAFNVWVQIAGGRLTPITLAGLLAESQGFRISFWSNFGGVNIIAPDWVYTFLDAFTLLALVGLLIGWLRRTLPRLLWLPMLWLVLILFSLVRWTWLTMASQGRLIFPAIAAVAVLLVAGLAQFELSRLKVPTSRFTIYGLVLPFAFLLFTFALLVPFALIAPAYAMPNRFSDSARVSNPTSIVFDQQAELVGYQVARSVAPNDELPIAVFWRAREPMTEDFSVSIVLFDAGENIVGRWRAFPGNGLYPTRLWQPGEIIEDQYRVPIAANALPGVGRVEVSLFRRVPLENLTARDAQGRVITPTLARFKIAGPSNVQIENPVDYKFGDSIGLVGYSSASRVAAGTTSTITLDWRALQAIGADYTVFAHLVDANGKIIAQQDDQPQHGAYPTSFWDAGETIADEHAMAIPSDAPPGNYRIEVGVYRASDGARLPVGNGDHIVLVNMQIESVK